MSEDNTGGSTTETGRVKDQLAKLQQDVKQLAKGLKRVAEEIESEWGEEVVSHGTKIGGVEF